MYVLAVLLAAFVWQLIGLPWPVVIGAVGASGALALLLWLLAGRSRDSPPTAVGVVLCGAVLAALPAAHLTQWLSDHLPANAAVTGAALLAPVVEESVKALVLLATLWLRSPAGRWAAVTRGAWVGLGFTLMENTQYLLLAALQGGWPRVLLATYVRGVVGGLHHAVFTASAAAVAVRSQSLAVAVTAWLWAIAQHSLWNAAAAPWMTERLCGAASEGATCLPTPDLFELVVAAPAIALASLAPGMLTIYAAWRRRPGPERSHHG